MKTQQIWPKLLGIIIGLLIGLSCIGLIFKRVSAMHDDGIKQWSQAVPTIKWETNILIVTDVKIVSAVDHISQVTLARRFGDNDTRHVITTEQFSSNDTVYVGNVLSGYGMASPQARTYFLRKVQK